MAKKSKSKKAAAASGDAQAEDPSDVARIAEMSRQMFGTERDTLLSGELPDSALPQDETEFAARDPFSADFILFRLDRSKRRGQQKARLNKQLRADLLEKPHLMENPAESGTRAGAAVWRSLRDLLRGETQALIDNSELEELLMLKRELTTRKAFAEAVNSGLESQLLRLEQRIAAFDPDDVHKAVTRAKSEKS